MCLFNNLLLLIDELESGLEHMDRESILAHRRNLQEKLSEELERIEETTSLPADFFMPVDNLDMEGDSALDIEDLIYGTDSVAQDLRFNIENYVSEEIADTVALNRYTE